MKYIKMISTIAKTPRTRNRNFDTTFALQDLAPVGYKHDWTFRKQLEADMRKLDFRSHKFSHKHERPNRVADDLWFSWTPYGKDFDFPSNVESVEVRVRFKSNTVAIFEIRRYEHFGRSSLIKGRMTITEPMQRTDSVLNYIKSVTEMPFRDNGSRGCWGGSKYTPTYHGIA